VRPGKTSAIQNAAFAGYAMWLNPAYKKQQKKPHRFFIGFSWIRKNVLLNFFKNFQISTNEQ